MNESSKQSRQKPKLLLYLGFMKPKAGWQRVMHCHKSCELMFVKNGSGIIQLENGKITFTDGDLVIYNPNVMHREFMNGDPNTEVVFFSISQLNVPGFEKGWLSREDCTILSTKQYYDSFVSLLDSLFLEKQNRELGYKKICDSFVNVLINYIIRLQSYEKTQADDQDTYTQARTYLDANYTMGESIDDICKRLYINKYYLIHLFKDATGISPLKYIINKRMDLAKEMLTLSDKSLIDVAKECGYSDVTYFTRVFKKVTGQTPSSYKKAHEKDN